MAIPAASAVAAQIAADIGTSDPHTLAALTNVCQRILDAVKLATLTVPGTGLVAPGGVGGPVTGAATGTIT